MKDRHVMFFLECGNAHFYRVEIHCNRRSMMRAVAALGGKCEKDDRAICLRYIADGRDAKTKRLKVTGELGTLFFTSDDLEPGVVIHELTHAAIGWARRTKVNPLKFSKVYRHCQEEKYAYLQQSLVERFYAKAPQAVELLRRRMLGDAPAEQFSQEKKAA